MLVEDALLDFGGELDRGQFVQDAAGFANGPGGEPETGGPGDQESGEGESHHRPKETAGGNARGTERGDFVVTGLTAEADQDTDEHAHGHRESESGDKNEPGKVSDDVGRGRAANQLFGELAEAAQEEDEGE